MSDKKTGFLERALPMLARGLRTIPLDGKAPFIPEWNKVASLDEAQIQEWSKKYPNANCGVLSSADVWILDVDNLSWFMENCPGQLPKTLVVRTGSGNLHLYFKHDQASKTLSLRPITNPRFKSKEETPDEPQKLVEYPQQVVSPGSIHPVSKTEYKILQDKPITLAPPEWITWLKSLERTGPSSKQLKINSLRHGWDPETELTKAGLKFKKSTRDGKTYFNYHDTMGKCLIKGSSHAGPNETPNPRQCAFVYVPETGDFYHTCFSGSCAVPGKTRIALQALGLKLEDAIQPAWRELFETVESFKEAKPLNWVVEGLATEESMNMLGGLSGHGKTWVMLAITKAILQGEKLFGRFQCTAPPKGILYLVPEVGRRSFWKRIKVLGMEELVESEQLLVRTLSMGPTIKLTDRGLLKAVDGRDVMLDTAIRFLDGEENAATDNNLSESGFAILNAGARSWWGVHHSPKTFGKENFMTLEGILRGTGDFGAMLSTCYGIRCLDPEKTLLHIECVKARDLDDIPRPFQIEGRPWIDLEQRFHLLKPPGECGFLDEELTKDAGKKGGRPREEARNAEIIQDKVAGLSLAEIGKKHGMSASAVSKVLRREGARATDQEEFAGTGF